MWSWLSDIWKGISTTGTEIAKFAGKSYDFVADSYVGQGIETAYDFVTGDESYGTFKASDFDNFNYAKKSAGYLGTALDFAGGFMDVIAPAGATTQMPSSKRRKVSAPRSTAGVGQFNVSKSNLANMQFGYTPRVNDAIIKANASKVPSIQMAIAQMVNYGNSSGATIKLQKAGMPSVTARTKMPTFAPKYYG